jgi:hypothetical protein
MGLAIALTLRAWQAPGRSLPLNEAALRRSLGGEPVSEDDLRAVLFDAFWVDDAARRVFSPWLQMAAGVGEPRVSIPAALKQSVRQRDMWKGRLWCAYCSADCTFIHHFAHIHPVSRGGVNALDNLQIACPTCNTSKGALTDEEFRDRRDTA